MNETCRFLSNGYKFHVNHQGNLVVRPCCLYKSEQVIRNKSDLDLWRSNINEINSYIEPNCNDCNFLDTTNVRESRRKLSFRLAKDNLSIGDPLLLEIQIDATCNGGCIMCGPLFSSFWAQELKTSTPIVRQQDYLSKIASLVDLQKVKNIIILGGEPMLSTVDSRLFELINDPSNVVLQFTTNGSIYPTDKQIKRWEKFKSVMINFSIDGVLDRFEYIRYPLKWNVVERNIVQMQKEMPANIVFKINHSVNILNLFYYDEILSWYDSISSRIKILTPTPVTGVFSPRSITSPLRDKILSKYSNEQVPARMIEDTNRDCTELLKFIAVIDQRRNLSWKKVFPEIAECLV